MSLTGVEEKLSADLGIYAFQTVTGYKEENGGPNR